MASFLIRGGNRLSGEIEIDSAKNSILPILAGTILCDKQVTIKNCTRYTDVLKMCDILTYLGANVQFEKKSLIIDNSNLVYKTIPNKLTKDIRSSIFALGPILARFKRAKIAMPGGCSIGERKVDIHIKLLKDLGVKIVNQHGYISCEYDNITPKELYLDFPSVGATENIIMFACANSGKYKIYNVAKEPEIVDLANFLNKMGAKIVGAGTNCIEILGVDVFNAVEYTPLPDRIETGTFMIASAMTAGDVTITNCVAEHVDPLIDILKKSGCEIEISKHQIRVVGKNSLKSFGRVDSEPYPGFPTDLQSQLTTLASICDGLSLVKENLFESRFKYVSELLKMGVDIKIENNLAIINGVEILYGAEVDSTDLRGGVSLVLAGLVANGYTIVNNVELIDRGYFKLEQKLSKLGAMIVRLD